MISLEKLKNIVDRYEYFVAEKASISKATVIKSLEVYTDGDLYDTIDPVLLDKDVVVKMVLAQIDTNIGNLINELREQL